MKYINPALPSVVDLLLNAHTNLPDTLLGLSERYGGVVHLHVGPRHVFLITSPSGVGHILQENQHNYRGFNYSHHHLKPFLGNGLLTSEGETWRRHRQLAQQAFHPRQIQTISVTMSETIQKFTRRWDELPPQESVVDIRAECTLLTLSVVTASLFGSNIGEQAMIVKDSFPIVMHYLIDQMMNPLMHPQWLPTRKNRDYRKALDSLNAVVRQLISRDCSQVNEQSNLLEMLIAARGEGSAARLDGEELRDEVMTIFMAGHETCANALTWTFYNLALHPHIQERLADEVEQVLQGRPPTYAEVHQLTYTSMVFNETLRLFPPAWIMGRDVIADDVIDGYPIPAGSLVVMSPYVTHRLTTLWDASPRFDPDRFEPAKSNQIPRFAFFPFGGGQRQCLGKNFALVEAMLVISGMVQRYKFTFPEDSLENHPQPQTILPDIDMRPRTPILLRIEKR